MAGKQKYNQICPIASALDVLGSRWALLVIRELALGPRRFGDIHAGLETASTDMVTNRLRELEATGLVERTEDRRYQLTPAGFALGPMLRSMVVWSMRTGALDTVSSSDAPATLGPDPVRRVVGLLGLLARTTNLDAATALGSAGQVVTLTVDELTVQVAQGHIGYRFSDHQPTTAAGEISVSVNALVGIVIGGESMDPYIAAGEIQASTDVAERVLDDLAIALAEGHKEMQQPVA